MLTDFHFHNISVELTHLKSNWIIETTFNIKITFGMLGRHLKKCVNTVEIHLCRQLKTQVKVCKLNLKISPFYIIWSILVFRLREKKVEWLKCWDNIDAILVFAGSTECQLETSTFDRLTDYIFTRSIILSDEKIMLQLKVLLSSYRKLLIKFLGEKGRTCWDRILKPLGKKYKIG